MQANSLLEYKCFYKTEICKYKEECLYPNTCFFAHSKDEIKNPICINFCNRNSCLDESCTREHTHNTPFLCNFLTNILTDIIVEKREKAREREREFKSLHNKKRSRSRSRGRGRSRFNSRSRSPKRSNYTESKNCDKNEENLHSYYQKQVDELHKSYQDQIAVINAQSANQLLYLQQMIHVKNTECENLRHNMQGLLNHLAQIQQTTVPVPFLQQAPQHAKNVVAQQNKTATSPANKTAEVTPDYLSEILKTLNQYIQNTGK